MKRAAALLAAAALACTAAPHWAHAAEPVEAEPELQLVYRPPAEPPRKVGRAFLEFSAVLVYENYRYWDEAGFAEDWQFKFTWEDQKRRLLELEGVRFDSNGFEINWTHAYAGAVYYSIGRINNLGVGESFLLSAFASLYWEAVVEWREVFSVNDTMMTDFGALSIGEPWYQLSRYLLSRQSPAARVLGFIHPLNGLHWVLDPASRPRPTDSQTLPGHGVYLSLGAATTDSPSASDSGSFTSVGLRSRLALAPGYTAPGTESRQGWEVLSSTFNLNADFDGGTARELDVSSGVVIYGRLDRSVGEDSQGSASILGIGSAFTLFRKEPVTDYDAGRVRVRMGDDLHLEEPRDFRDKYAIVHLLGPVYEGYWRGANASVAWGVEAYPDFALVNAYALNTYSAEHDIAGVKTTLLYYGYYYGYGASLKAHFDAALGPVTIGTAASLSYHESIEGLDRYEEELTGDVHATDAWYRFDARFGVPLPGTNWALEATARWSSRRGTLGDTVTSGTESRYSLVLTWRL
jgi:hypothetical protein